MRYLGYFFYLLLLAPLLCGCGSKKADENVPLKIKEVSHDKLVKLRGETLTELEGSNVEIFTPKGWHTLGRSTTFLCGYYYKEEEGYPRILVEEVVAGADQIQELTRQNVVKYAEQTMEELQEVGLGEAILEPPLPMMLGNRACTRYVLAAKAPLQPNTVLDRQIIKTVVKGQVYTVELQVVTGTILKYRDVAYSVVESIKAIDLDAIGDAESSKNNGKTVEK